MRGVLVTRGGNSDAPFVRRQLTGKTNTGTHARTGVLDLQERRALNDDPAKFEDEPQTDMFMAVAETLGCVAKNNVEDYGAGVPNDLAAIVGAYVRGE